MNWLRNLLGKKTAVVEKTVADQKREALVNSGKEQFKKLLEMGLKIHAVPLK